jgi:hypothetical protein
MEKYNMSHENLNAVIHSKILHQSVGIEREEVKLIHEHYFVPHRLNGLNRFVACCITCNDCYCSCWGKLIK